MKEFDEASRRDPREFLNQGSITKRKETTKQKQKRLRSQPLPTSEDIQPAFTVEGTAAAPDNYDPEGGKLYKTLRKKQLADPAMFQEFMEQMIRDGNSDNRAGLSAGELDCPHALRNSSLVLTV